MTRSEIEATVALFAAAGRKNIPVPIAEWRELQMSTKSIGKVSKKALAQNKIKPVQKSSVSQKIGAKAKADRTEKGLRANREKRK